MSDIIVVKKPLQPIIIGDDRPRRFTTQWSPTLREWLLYEAGEVFGGVADEAHARATVQALNAQRRESVSKNVVIVIIGTVTLN